MKKNLVELAKVATSVLHKAEEECGKTLTTIFPIGSRWWCNHGTRRNKWERPRSEYLVEIKFFEHYCEGFIVENVKTHKRKRVHSSSLVRSGA